MGTRHLTMVIEKKKPVVAQYGQWDGYPSGQGITILEFLRNTNLETFKEKLKKVRFMNEDDDKKLKEFHESIGSKDGWVNMEQAAKVNEKYPYLSRDNGSDILNMIFKSYDQEILIGDSSDFAGDSLFCEWGYVVDLDKNVLEVYKGFNKRKLGKTQRFAKLEGREGYEPIRCIKKYKLSELPSEDNFVAELEKE
jgi:hypothetical protein